MQAIRVHHTGEPDVMQLEEVADLQPGPGQVLVKVEAAGVNPVETYIRAGKYPQKAPLPYTPGSDAAGTIAAVGEGVGNWHIGDRVFTGRSQSGSYAEFTLCAADMVFRLPDSLSFEQGAAIGLPYATAHRALFGKAGAKKGESVFVHGATGGVGVAAIQLAQAAGLTVGGSAGTSSGERFLASLGLKYTTNHNVDNYLSDVIGMTCGRGFDIILEMLANQNLGSDPEVLAPFGRIVIIGNRGTVEVNPRDWMSRDATIYAMTLFNVPPAGIREIYNSLGEGLERGELKPQIDKAFALSEAPEAHEAVMASGSHGKIILKP
ncbi:phthiocerol/phenolphthiocerol synthesis polyketide synthase type I PpsC [Abditibacteriota bacterium]|nr:phthiocerol/phenolphthiocerol synthesis polyketide synthase type I PpsC [Abditibacteriota bacterium]